MSKPMKIEGVITKVIRKNGKSVAEVSVNIPASQSSDVPLGAVIITVEEKQGEMFPGKAIKADHG